MLSPTWTPDALSSEFLAFSGPVWRLVEAQHFVSTLKLVDDLAEQEVLEEILDNSKPSVPAACRHLDYLLSAPFRYRTAYPHGSRFRRAGMTPGVYYAAERPETAVAEMVFYRFLFYAESPTAPFPDNAAEYTAFSVELASKQTIDLTAEPLYRDTARWTHPTDYTDCQTLADSARDAGADVIRYMSVRDPAHKANVAVLSCGAFASRGPDERRSWHIRIGSHGATALCEHPRQGVDFPTSSFASDPRLAAMNWNRGQKKKK